MRGEHTAKEWDIRVRFGLGLKEWDNSAKEWDFRVRVRVRVRVGRVGQFCKRVGL